MSWRGTTLSVVTGNLEATYTVSALAAAIGRAVDRSFPDEVWVRGEIRDLSRAPSGHVYFSLVDADAATERGAEVVLPVVLFASDRDPVNWALRRAGAGRMVDGVEVRIRGRVVHYAARGSVQLKMTWIDTEYTLGRLAAERSRVLRVLEAEGLLDRNASLPFPLVPLRIGLVTSAGSAAEADFVHELEQAGAAFTVLLVDTRVQGPDAVASLVRAIELLRTRPVDIVALVRGGGAQTDLAAFDREEVARAIATMPVPVVTGIGHEIDDTVADRVAARAHKTPTACAADIVATVAAYRRRLGRHAQRIVSASRGSLVRRERDLRYGAARLRRADAALRRPAWDVDRLAERLGRAGTSALEHRHRAVMRVGGRISDAAAARLGTREGRVDAAVARLVGARASLDRADAKLDLIAAVVDGTDPRRILARGWSLTRRPGGATIRSVDEVGTGDVLESVVADGRMMSRVERIEREEPA